MKKAWDEAELRIRSNCPDQDQNLEKLNPTLNSGSLSDLMSLSPLFSSLSIKLIFYSNHISEKVRFWMFGVKLYPDPSSDIEKRKTFFQPGEKKGSGDTC